MALPLPSLRQADTGPRQTPDSTPTASALLQQLLDTCSRGDARALKALLAQPDCTPNANLIEQKKWTPLHVLLDASGRRGGADVSSSSSVHGLQSPAAAFQSSLSFASPSFAAQRQPQQPQQQQQQQQQPSPPPSAPVASTSGRSSSGSSSSSGFFCCFTPSVQEEEYDPSQRPAPATLRSSTASPANFLPSVSFTTCLELLIAAGADPNARDSAGLTPLMLAVMGRAGPGARAVRYSSLLLRAPLVDPNIRESGARRGALALCLLSLPEGPGEAPLKAKLSVLAALLAAGADPNLAADGGVTPLMAAAARGCDRMVLHALLEAGADSRIMDNGRRSALSHAVLAMGLAFSNSKEQQLGLSSRITEAPANGHGDSNGISAIITVNGTSISTDGDGSPDCTNGECSPSTNGHCSTHQEQRQQQQEQQRLELVSRRSSRSQQEQQQQQPLATISRQSSRSLWSGRQSPVDHEAADAARRAGVVRELCSWGGLDLHPATINTAYSFLEGRTQMHIAVRRGDAGAVERLIANGAAVNAKDDHGNTPLMYWQLITSEDASQAVIHTLLQNGADPNMANKEGLRPLDLAVRMTHHGRLEFPSHLVPSHALLVAYGARNSTALLETAKRPMTRGGKASMSVLTSARSFGESLHSAHKRVSADSECSA